jgi:hypothetical protein
MNNEAERTERPGTEYEEGQPDAEMVAMTIKGILDSEGVPAQIVGPSVLPNLEFQVQVSEEMAEEARVLIEEARQAGPAAAAEGEAASEGLEGGESR